MGTNFSGGFKEGLLSLMKSVSETFFLNFLCLSFTKDFKVSKFHSCMVFIDGMFVHVRTFISNSMITNMLCLLPISPFYLSSQANLQRTFNTLNKIMLTFFFSNIFKFTLKLDTSVNYLSLFYFQVNDDLFPY